MSPWIGPVAAPAHYPAGVATGGAETQTWLIARGLAERGHRVSIFARQAPRPLPDLIEGVRMVMHDPTQGGRRSVPYAGHGHMLLNLIRDLDAGVLVQRAAGAETGLAAGVAAIRRRPFVYASANVIDFDFARIERSRSRRRLFEWGVRRADAVVVQTEEQAALCRERFRRDPTVISSIAEMAEPRRTEPRAFLWIGRLAPYKNPGAFVHLASALPEARFRMTPVPPAPAGSGLEEAVRDAAVRLPNLEILEPRPRGELLELIDDAVAVVVTSDFEGMPNVFLEAWARGVPCLALEHDPNGVLEREGLGGFAAGDQARLTELAKELWRTKSDRREVSRRCRAYARREHSPERVIESWEGLLAGLCEASPP